MAYNKIVFGGETLIDLTSDTITEETLVEGYTAHSRSGEIITGTLSEATEEKKGLMSASDKIKLNGIATGAEANVQSDWDATSGDAFIKNKPTIPTKLSQLTNDTNFTSNVGTVTSVKVGTTSYAPSSGVVSLPDYPTIPGVATASANGLMSKTDKSNLDTIVNSFNNDDSNTTIDTIKEVLKAFENAPEGTNIANALFGKVDKVDGKGLSTNDFTSTYKTKLDGIASGAEVNVQSDWNVTDTTSDAYIKNKPTLFSGSYNDLTNKPTIPTVNNGQLTIQKNGTNVATFTANQSGNATANITVPTKVSELTNDSGFTTNTGTVTSVKVGDTSYSPSSGVVSLPAYPSVPTSLKNPNALSLKVNSETSAFTSYDGSAVKTFTIAPSSTAGAFTISDGTTTKTIQLAGKFTDNNTTYESKEAVSGGTAVSLVTTGEKYTWNNKANTSVATTSANGLMSSTDKTRVDSMWNVWSSDGTTDTLVNKVSEVLTVFENYPEGNNLVEILATKASTSYVDTAIANAITNAINASY